MEGWKINSGLLKETELVDKQIWHYFNKLFSSKSINQTSYKFAFLKSILQNVYLINNDGAIHFDKIFHSFSRIYWTLIINNGLTQSNVPGKAMVEKDLITFQTINKIPKVIKFDSLQEDLQLQISELIKKIGIKYVIGALYGDTEGRFFGFDKKSEILCFNLSVVDFMKKQQQILTKLNNYEFIKYLHKNNSKENCDNLIEKVENSTRRASLGVFKKLLLIDSGNVCFYCEKLMLSSMKFHVDHFIPWSFVFMDYLWNFVLCCQGCNGSKKDRLPDEIFLQKIINRNCKLIKNTDDDVSGEMESYQLKKLLDLYNYCNLNGFKKNWVPKTVLYITRLGTQVK